MEKIKNALLRAATLHTVTKRFLQTVLPTLAGLLLVMLVSFLLKTDAQRALALAPFMQRLECTLHCLAVSVGGALLIELACRDRDAKRTK